MATSLEVLNFGLICVAQAPSEQTLCACGGCGESEVTNTSGFCEDTHYSPIFQSMLWRTLESRQAPPHPQEVAMMESALTRQSSVEFQGWGYP